MNKTDCNRLRNKAEYCSANELAGHEERKLGEEEGADRQTRESDSFLVRDERLLSSGKLQVHIFLPQTEYV